MNAHELAAHQWFGNLITAESGKKHHCHRKGLPLYYALLAELDIYGDDYFIPNWLTNRQQRMYHASKDHLIPF
jgi:aminopeptidase N